MSSNHALAVSNHDELRSNCATALADLGFSVTAVPNGALALEAARLQRPRVVLLGLSSADSPGHDLLRALRKFCDASVLVVDPDGHDGEKAHIPGADGWLTAPVDAGRLRAYLEILPPPPDNFAPPSAEVRVFGELTVDVAAREVLLRGKALPLTRTEFDLLARLSETPRRVLTREYLIEAVWGADWYGDGHLLDVHVGNVRHKLGESGRRQRFIQTVRGVGFRFNPQPDAPDNARPQSHLSVVPRQFDMSRPPNAADGNHDRFRPQHGADL
jgi:DNA-binding response OmpR family regulator